jgi:TonB family protein
MTTAATPAPVRGFTNTRRVPRFSLSVPPDVTVLRSGIPYSIPGRSVTLSEHGLGMMVAGELGEGDSVGVEFRLPEAGGRLRLKAVVRYQALLHCGLEFQHVTLEQQTLIEHWTRRKAAPPRARAATPSKASQVPAPAVPVPKRGRWRLVVGMILVAAIAFAGFGWWYWHRAWDELEAQLPSDRISSQAPPASVATEVPAEVIERFITHKIEPSYPETARRAHIEGVVVLSVLIGTDGTVLDVRATSGPDEVAPAAIDAVKWWRFQPYVVNSQPVHVKTTLAVEFRGN